MVKKSVRMVSVFLFLVGCITTFSKISYASGETYDFDQQTITINLKEKSSNTSNDSIGHQLSGIFPSMGDMVSSPIFVLGIGVLLIIFGVFFFKYMKRGRFDEK